MVALKAWVGTYRGGVVAGLTKVMCSVSPLACHYTRHSRDAEVPCRGGGADGLASLGQTARIAGVCGGGQDDGDMELKPSTERQDSPRLLGGK